MLSSFVLRLRPDALADGGIVGEVEDVDSGVRVSIRSVDDLIAFLARHGGSDATQDQGKAKP